MIICEAIKMGLLAVLWVSFGQGRLVMLQLYVFAEQFLT